MKEFAAFIGSKTETALLQFSEDLNRENWKETCESAKTIRVIPFSSERRADGHRSSPVRPVSYEDLSHDMTLVAITSIKDPLRPGVSEAVTTCHHAGVTIKMCTGDNVLTARSIASAVSTPLGVSLLEGFVFCAPNPDEHIKAIPRLQVLARSSPEDEKVRIETHRDLGEIVGVTTGGMNDGPTLKTANVGFSMGITSTGVMLGCHPGDKT
jgi:magnesium-transporting ATPase (P-type)